MKKLIFILICMLLMSTLTAQKGNCRDLSAKSMDSLQLATFIDSIVREYNIPGLSATAIGGTELVWNGNFGFQDLEDSIPVSDSTVFACMSVSKTFTATAVMQMTENELCDLDNDINGYLNYPVTNPNFPLNIISTRQLLSHVSSIEDGDIFSVITPGADSPIALGYYLENYLSPGGVYYNNYNFNSNSAPGTHHSYSNIGIALAGYLVDTLSESGFNTYCKDSIFTPIGMTDATWLISEIDTAHFASWYHQSGSGLIPFEPTGVPWYPAGTMTSSALQLSNYVIAMMNGGIYNGTRILSEESVTEMCSPQYPTTDSDYGLGIMNTNLGDRAVTGHAGNHECGRARMYWCPDEYTGIVVLTNVNCNLSAMAQIMLALFDYAEDHVVWPKMDEQILQPDIEVDIYPNPATDHITISLDRKTEITGISIYDLNGQLLNKNRTLKYSGFQGQYKIELSGLSAGTYLIVIENARNTINRKIVKI